MEDLLAFIAAPWRLFVCFDLDAFVNIVYTLPFANFSALFFWDLNWHVDMITYLVVAAQHDLL